jgi:hypothetical protein
LLNKRSDRLSKTNSKRKKNDGPLDALGGHHTRKLAGLLGNIASYTGRRARRAEGVTSQKQSPGRRAEFCRDQFPSATSTDRKRPDVNNFLESACEIRHENDSSYRFGSFALPRGRAGFSCVCSSDT